MKKAFLIGIPVIAIVIIAGFAFTQADSDRRPEARRYRDLPGMLAGGGLRLGIVVDTDRDQKGARVQDVERDSPAEKAGMKEGDVITRIDGKGVEDARDVREILRDLDKPKKLNIEIERDGKRMTLTATPEERRELHMLRGFGGNYLGVDLQDLDSDLASYFKVDPKSGVLVTRIESDSPAQKAGLRSGDILTQINGKKIGSQDDLREELNDLKEGEEARLTVLRHGREERIVAHPEKRGLRDFPELERFARNPEMMKLRDELRELPERPEVRRNMDELKEQLRDLQNEINRELKPQIEQLKKELEKLRKSD